MQDNTSACNYNSTLKSDDPRHYSNPTTTNTTLRSLHTPTDLDFILTTKHMDSERAELGFSEGHNHQLMTRAKRQTPTKLTRDSRLGQPCKGMILPAREPSLQEELQPYSTTTKWTSIQIINLAHESLPSSPRQSRRTSSFSLKSISRLTRNPCNDTFISLE